MKIFLTVLLMAFCVTGCTYKTPVDISPAYGVYSNYDSKVPGHFALYVDSKEMNKIVKVQGYNCSAHSYPVDAEKQFEMSVYKTFENLLEKVTLLDNPVDSTSLKELGYRAMINIEVEDMNIRLRLIPGFWTAEMEADTEITASMIVDGQNGRKLGVSVEGNADYITEAGGGCSGGADAIGVATQDAIKETVGRLGERVTNARKLREKNSISQTIVE